MATPVSLRNDRDQITFYWSGNLSDKAIFSDLKDGSQLEISPNSAWTSYSSRPLAITRPNTNSGLGWGPQFAGTFFGLIWRHPNNTFQHRHYTSNGEAISGALNTSLNPFYSGAEEYFLHDLNGNGFLDDRGNYKIQDLNVKEGSDGIVVVTRTSRKAQRVSVIRHRYYGIGDNAAAYTGLDFPTNYSRVISFGEGETRKTALFPTIDDPIAEEDELVPLKITVLDQHPDVQTVFADDVGIVTIKDNDGGRYNYFTLEEGVNGTEGDFLRIKVTRSGNIQLPATLSVKQVRGSATGGSDYKNVRRSIYFPKGLSTNYIYLTTINDSIKESDETVLLDLSTNNRAYTFTGSSTAQFTIKDDGDESDGVSSFYRVSEKSLEFTEPKSGKGNYLISLSRRGFINKVDRIRWEVTGNTATEGLDYSFSQSYGTMQFNRGVRDGSISIQIHSDNIKESTEYLTFSIKSLNEDSTIQPLSQRINIQDNSYLGSRYLRFESLKTSTWSDVVRINSEKNGSTSDSVIQAKQVEKSEYDSGFVGSIVNGTSDEDTIRGLAGFDQLFGKAGDDLIHGGNGRDIIDGGSGSDELHGDFGWNTFLDQQDGSKDLIAIKSDQHLSNWWYGKAGNSPNGEKADFIEGLDATDEIKIIGVFTPDISVVDNVTARGVTGIGIYAKGTLEAVYTGGNLSTSQIQNMTTGDGSTTAMNNQMWSYWSDNTVPPLQA
ncbi:Calx-beta domain-containing protein [Synechococcus sp. N26]|uniref:Calx-beta domain-containing protein n=1 Tax=Synechococcus sp. N26 TaxID=2575513 RepID=UPI000E0F304C|nr:Calx-beta domain-containing protein [Synechococcus sp. N26]